MPNKIPMSAVSSVVEALLRTEAHSATKYLSDKQIVRATRKLFGKKIQKRGNIEILLTIGRPNYSEREFIEYCKLADEPFPVKKIQFKIPPNRR